LPGVMSAALAGSIRGAGSVLSSLSMAPLAMALRSAVGLPSLSFGTMSSRSTGTPALAIW